jgi:flavin reductase (DIM6/NTAB) family NADH-FMN oxidoreductase RutF
MSGNLLPLFASLTHGVYVIGVSALGRKNAFTAAWVMQSSFDPPMLALSINPAHSSYALLKSGGFFTVNVLGKQQRDLALHFGTPKKEDKLATVNWHEAKSGTPILDTALAWFECKVSAEITSSDHVLALGKVIDGDLHNVEDLPLYYGEVSSFDSSRCLLPDTIKPWAFNRETL